MPFPAGPLGRPRPSKTGCPRGLGIASFVSMVQLTCEKSPAFFMADAHLGLDPRGDPRRILALSSFFAHVEARKGDLFILGDFFDFWFEYASVIPKHHFEILTSLKELTSSGTAVTYIGGNHDFWIGEFLREKVGLKVLTGAADLRAQGRRLFLAHGDDLAQRDRLYPLLRGFLHSRPVTALYRLLHPDLGLPLARLVSRISRGYNPDWTPDKEKIWNEVAAPRFDQGFDAVVLGHIHDPIGVTRGGRSLFVLGDWISRFGYLVLSDGKFEQLRWRMESRGS